VYLYASRSLRTFSPKKPFLFSFSFVDIVVLVLSIHFSSCIIFAICVGSLPCHPSHPFGIFLHISSFLFPLWNELLLKKLQCGRLLGLGFRLPDRREEPRDCGPGWWWYMCVSIGLTQIARSKAVVSPTKRQSKVQRSSRYDMSPKSRRTTPTVVQSGGYIKKLEANILGIIAKTN